MVLLQETYKELIIENDVGYIWHDDEFHFLVAVSFGKSGGVLTIWDKNKFKMESYIVKSRGDFYAARKKSERLGQKDRSYGIKEFNEFIDICNLVEVPLVGRKFTWTGAVVNSLPRNFSDHVPILLSTENTNLGSRPFKLFHVWLEKED
ncbi:hypothetical protein V6N13_113475 [Hibiscus sabdariffa]